MRKLILSAAIAAAASVPAFAQKPDAASASVTKTTPGKGTITNMAKITASVEAIDAAARTVTLKGPRGKVVTLAVGPEVKNFAQVKVGDMVVVRYAEALSLELKLRDPEQVKLVKVGDQVEATYREAVAISVEPAPKAKAAVTK